MQKQRMESRKLYLIILQDIMNGGEIIFQMTSTPTKKAVHGRRKVVFTDTINIYTYEITYN